MLIEFMNDYREVEETVQAYLCESGTACDECLENKIKVYKFTSDSGMFYHMCRPCIDADEYVRVGRSEPIRYDRGSASRGFLQLLGLVAGLLFFLALFFWPQVVVWLSEFFGV